MRKNTTRDEIVKTAARLFYKQGYNGTGINQIIEETGIAKSSLYENFRSKEDLLAEYLRMAALQTNDALKATINKVKNPRDRVAAIFDFLCELVQQKEYYGCNFLNIVSEISVENVRIRSQIKAQKDKIRDLFEEALNPIKKEGLADELYTLFEGALIANKVHNEKWPVLAAKNIAMRLL